MHEHPWKIPGVSAYKYNHVATQQISVKVDHSVSSLTHLFHVVFIAHSASRVAT